MMNFLFDMIENCGKRGKRGRPAVFPFPTTLSKGKPVVTKPLYYVITGTNPR